ncbi:hypothetical protein [Sutcliffiella deserti]|uniref:hypothetical protein n=1 Tax=Sutcliffiella deserti TaxID=2875501 RepID=UPI001CBD002D|nr:hypothetical protein [Sutcliffiella deserti]
MKNNIEWLEPLKKRPDLLMDEKTSENIQKELRKDRQRKHRYFVSVPTILVSVAVLVLVLFVLPSFLPSEEGTQISAEIRDALVAFEEIAEPIHHLTTLPFEPKHIVSDSGITPGFGYKYVDVRYFGETEEKLLSFQVYFESPDGLNRELDEGTDSFETRMGIEVTYKNNGEEIYWQDDNKSFLIINRSGALTEQEIEGIVNSMRIYE